MAISKIKPRHANEGRSIAAVLKDQLDYDKNPEKTKGGLLVSSYQCSADTAWQEFTVSKQIYEATTGRRRDPDEDVISYLLIQSFRPGEITPEEANRLGCIFRKNCASVPEERSAIPLQTEQSSAG